MSSIYNTMETPEERHNRVMAESQAMVDKFAINYEELLYQSNMKQASHAHPLIVNSAYNPNDIRQMNTYNALRWLYRTRYDLRSIGYQDVNTGNWVGREKHPINGAELPCNYINDFSMSGVFNPDRNNKFTYSMCEIAPGSVFPFTDKNGFYKNLASDRLSQFINSEMKKKKAKNYTADFFSWNRQVNPLLYTYMCPDEDGDTIVMQPDYFLEKGIYSSVFNNENYIHKGNQLSSLLWAYVTNMRSKKQYVYDEEEDTPTDIYNEIFENDELLFKDKYTIEFMNVLQNPSKYYKFQKQCNFEMSKFELQSEDIQRDSLDQVKTREETRGYLFYDALLDIVFARMENIIKNDKNAPQDAYNKVQTFKGLIHNPRFNNKLEFDGFPMDSYLAKHGYIQYHSADQAAMDKTMEDMGDYLVNSYRYNYYVVFAQAFKILPYLLSPAYKFAIQSPAMNIMLAAFTIMAVKTAHSKNYDDFRKRFFDPLYDAIENINQSGDWNTYNVYNHFDDVFEESFLSSYAYEHLIRILPVLMRNNTAVNYNHKEYMEGRLDMEDVDTYFTDKLYSFVESSPIRPNTEDVTIYVTKALILLSEFFHKMEHLRYFDASTFCIDYVSIGDEETKKSLRLFADSLQEACYIYMNTLGATSFFNGEAPAHYNVHNSRSIVRDDCNPDLIGLDDTRVMKTNVQLFKDIQGESESTFHKHNSYHSYMPMINLYTSLVYSIYITIDNIYVNKFTHGPYNQKSMLRPQSLWTILKRYAIHMTYMNNNSYGIWNDKAYSNNNDITIRRIMASQRIKWLTYGLHLKVWFNDGYFFYTNYKRLMMIHNGDVNAAYQDMVRLYNDHYEGISKHIPIFYSLCNGQMNIPLPNIGLTLAPTMGSYTGNACMACFKYYMNHNNDFTLYGTALAHHIMKDSMVGDSMSTIVGDRLACVESVINNSIYANISFNNINNRMQVIYNSLGTSAYYELAMGTNLAKLYENVIRPYYLKNETEALALNSVSSMVSYDISFFKKETNDYYADVVYDKYTWCSRVLKEAINSNDKGSITSLIGRLINLYRLSLDNFCANFSSNAVKLVSALKPKYENYYGFSLSNSSFINQYEHGVKRLVSDDGTNNIFNVIMDNLSLGAVYEHKTRISNLLGRTNAKNCFEDCIGNSSRGGTIYGMYEDPMALIAHNNINFMTGYFRPSLESLYMLGKDILARVYLTMKRLIVDLNYGGSPIEKIVEENNCSINDAKYAFITDTIDYYYMVMNKSKINEENYKVFNNIKNSGDLYDFGLSIGQFMDYDYFAAHFCQIMDNTYGEDDGRKFISNLIKNKGRDYNRHCFYRDQMDTFKTMLSTIIDHMIKKRHGSLLVEKDFAIKQSAIRPFIDDDIEIINDIDKNLNQRRENVTRNISSFQSSIDDNENVSIDLNDNERVANYLATKVVGATEEQYKSIKDEEVEKVDKENEKKQLSINERINEHRKNIANLEKQLKDERLRMSFINGDAAWEELSRKVIPPTRGTEEDMASFSILKEKGFEVGMLNALRDINKTIQSMKDVLLDFSFETKATLSKMDKNIELITAAVTNIGASTKDDKDSSDDSGESDIGDCTDDIVPPSANVDTMQQLRNNTHVVPKEEESTTPNVQILEPIDDSSGYNMGVIDPNTIDDYYDCPPMDYDDIYGIKYNEQFRKEFEEYAPTIDYDNAEVHYINNNFESVIDKDYQRIFKNLGDINQNPESYADEEDKDMFPSMQTYDMGANIKSNNLDYNSRANDTYKEVVVKTIAETRNYPEPIDISRFSNITEETLETLPDFNKLNSSMKEYDKAVKDSGYVETRILDTIKLSNEQYNEALHSPSVPLNGFNFDKIDAKITELFNTRKDRPEWNSIDIYKYFNFDKSDSDTLEEYKCCIDPDEDHQNAVYDVNYLNFTPELYEGYMSRPSIDGIFVANTAKNLTYKYFSNWMYHLNCDSVQKVFHVWHSLSYEEQQNILLGKYDITNPYMGYDYNHINQIVFTPWERRIISYFRLHPDIYARLNDLQKLHMDYLYIKEYTSAHMEDMVAMSMHLGLFVDVMDPTDKNLPGIIFYLENENIDLSKYMNEARNVVKNQLDCKTSVPISINDGFKGITGANISNNMDDYLTSEEVAQIYPYKSNKQPDMTNLSSEDKANLERADKFKMCGTKEPVGQTKVFDGKKAAENDVKVLSIMHIDPNLSKAEAKALIDRCITDPNLKIYTDRFFDNMDWDNCSIEARKYGLETIAAMKLNFMLTHGKSVLSSDTLMFQTMLNIAQLKQQGNM